MEEYARTEFGIYKVIGKYERNRNNDLCTQLGDFYTEEFNREEYESSLKLGKLIDLIEVGDIVNKSEVYEIGQSENGQKWIHTCRGFLYYEEDLEKVTILTHEQYKQNCYTVERKENKE